MNRTALDKAISDADANMRDLCAFKIGEVVDALQGHQLQNTDIARELIEAAAGIEDGDNWLMFCQETLLDRRTVSGLAQRSPNLTQDQLRFVLGAANRKPGEVFSFPSEQANFYYAGQDDMGKVYGFWKTWAESQQDIDLEVRRRIKQASASN